MTNTTTPKLGLTKAVPGTAQAISRVTHFNNNWDILETLLDDLDEKGSFLTFTPTAVAGFTVGNGSLIGRHLKIGSLAIVKVEFQAGSTSTFSGVFEVGSFPNAAVGQLGSANMIGGIVYSEHVSTSSVHVGCLRTNGTSTGVYMAVPSGRISNVIPFAWVSPDVFKFIAIYECAP
jgi:hypothetical protein